MNNLFRAFISRPVLAWVLNLLFVAAGLMTMTQLPMTDEPTKPDKVIFVEARLDGLVAVNMEKVVTKVIESCVAGAPGLDYYTSSSSDSRSRVWAFFKTGELESAAARIREELTARQTQFPREMLPPTIKRGDQQVSVCVSTICLYHNDVDSKSSGGNTEYQRMRKLQDTGSALRTEILAVNGVADCSTSELDPKITVYLDPQAMFNKRVSARSAFEAFNARRSYGAGMITHGLRSTRVSAELDLPIDHTKLADIRVPTIDGKDSIPIGKIAQIRSSVESDREVFRIDGQRGIVLRVIAKGEGNPITISKAVRSIVAKFQSSEDINIKIISDKGETIESELRSLIWAIFETIAIVLLIIGSLLSSISAAVIIMITIPISLVGVCTFMHFFGFSINYYTLLALIIAIGMIVDDAIFVVESIFSRIEQGLNSMDAALRSIGEIYLPIIGMTFTLSAVFTPIILIGDDPRSIQFATTLAIAVIISGFVALVLSPMMCSRMLTVSPHKNNADEDAYFSWAIAPWYDRTVYVVRRSVHLLNRGYDTLERTYHLVLKRCLHHKHYIAFLVFPAIVTLGLSIYNNLPYGFSAEEGESVTVQFLSPQGATLAYVDTYTRMIESEMSKFEDRRYITSHTEVGSASYVRLVLRPARERHYKVVDIQRALISRLQGVIPGIQIINEESDNQQNTSESYEVTIYGKIDDDQMQTICDNAITAMSGTNLFMAPPRLVTQFNTAEHFALKPISEERMHQLGVSPRTIGETLKYCTKEGLVWGYVDLDQKRIEITGDLLPLAYEPHAHTRSIAEVPREQIARPRTAPAPRSSINDLLSALCVERHDPITRRTELIPLAQVVTATMISAPKALFKHKGQRSMRLTGIIQPGVGLAQVHTQVQQALKKVLPLGVRVEGGAKIKKLEEEGSTSLLMYIGAVVFMFLFLAALYESFVDPLITIPSIPLALTGGCIGLLMTGSSITDNTIISVLTVMGLIIKNGILIVYYANLALTEGLDPHDAVLAAMRERFRPILMTTLAMILGMVSLLHDHGVQAAMRHELAVFVIFGMVCGTILTILIVPCVYVILKSFFGTKSSRRRD
jgi:multidrug efflux pump subunit AcrB